MNFCGRMIKRYARAKYVSVLCLGLLLILSMPPKLTAVETVERSPTDKKYFAIEDMITEGGKWQASLSLIYTNIHHNSMSYSLVQLQGGSYLVFASDQQSLNEDLISYSGNLRYGIKKDLEIYTFLNYFSDYRRENTVNGSASDEEHKFKLLGMGLSYRIAEEGRYPALHASLSSHVIDNERFSDDYELNYLKTYALSLASYYTTDPLVFMVQTGYQLNLGKKKDDVENDPGEILYVSPKIYFAVNPYTSLNWGFRWTRQSSDRINDDVIAPIRTHVSYLFGIAYEIKTGQSILLDTEFINTASGDQSVVTMMFNFKL